MMINVTELFKDFRRYEKYCSCGYKAQVYLSISNKGDIAGFKRNAIITCPCCKRKIQC